MLFSRLPHWNPQNAGVAMTSLPASLEDLISAKLAALGLQHDESTTSFVQGIVEEDSFEPEVRLRLETRWGRELTCADAGQEGRDPWRAGGGGGRWCVQLGMGGKEER